MTSVNDYKPTHADRVISAMKTLVSNNNGTNGISMETRDFLDAFISREIHPEVAEGLELYISAYCGEENGTSTIDAAGVKMLCRDMYAAAPFDYAFSTESLWILPGNDK